MRVSFSRIAAGCALVLLARPAVADDTAASVALGGIQFKHELRISMEKERLTIGLSKVAVDYEFLNESDQDITTEVAFPIPPYEASHAYAVYPFDDFRLWIDGHEVKYDVEARAFLGKRDVTAILTGYDIDIATLAHSLGNKDDCSPDLERLPRDVRTRLTRAGLFEREAEDGCGGLPQWKVQKLYHWKQTFPAHKVLRVRHEYSPAFGFQEIGPADLNGFFKDGCLEASTQKALASEFAKAPGDAAWGGAEWVDFILTTANNWKTPIKDFELSIERSPTRNHGWYNEDWEFASVCWPGPVTRIDADHYTASAKNFIPTKDLHVVFLGIQTQDAPVAVAAAVPTKKRYANRRVALVAAAFGGLAGLAAVVWVVRRRRSVHKA